MFLLVMCYHPKQVLLLSLQGVSQGIEIDLIGNKSEPAIYFYYIWLVLWH